MGTEADIRTTAEKAMCQVEVVRLADRCRCGGSQVYDRWVLRLLGLRMLDPVTWSTMTRQTDETYEVAAFPSPEALGSWLLHRRPDSGDTARIAAGYCWQWTDPVVVDGDKTLVVAVLPGGGPPGSVPVTAM